MTKSLLIIAFIFALTACGTPPTSDPIQNVVHPTAVTPPLEPTVMITGPSPTPSVTLTPALPPTLVPTVAATAEPMPTAVPPQIGFQLLSTKNTPIVKRGSTDSWNDNYNDPGAIFYHDGQFHMFHNGFPGWPASSGINYHTSADGFTWKTMSVTPIFQASDYDIDGFTVVATSGLVTDAGEWALYLTLLKSVSGQVLGIEFRRATANNPLGPWLLHEEALLQPGNTGAWDELQIVEPMVIKQETGYVMYYSGYDADGIGRIGLAYSDDGITWEKYDDPTTDTAPFNESDPVLAPSFTWEMNGIQHPSVTKSPDGFVMFYRTPGSGGESGTTMKLGAATSKDGVVWAKIGAKPIYRPNTLPGNNATFVTALVYYDDVFYLFVDGFKGNYSEVYVLTYQQVFE